MEKKSNYRKFLLLWSGELVSAIGGGLTSFGLGVYVFQETGSAGSMALVTLLAFLPMLLLSAPAGVLADRYDRRLLMMAGDGLSATGLLYILACMTTGGSALYQICIGVFISSVFSSLLEPAYRATVTDLLSKEEYSKASGMVSIAGSARYLVSPLIAGLLLTGSDVKHLLMIDIGTFFLTVLCTATVRRGLHAKKPEQTGSFLDSFREGWKTITDNKGVLILFMLPFANNSLDNLVRTNIDAGKQGRAWGLISFLSQIGYVVAYGGASVLADIVASVRHTGVGRGAAGVIMIAGILLAAAAEVMEAFLQINRQGTSVLMVTHDSRIAGMCERILYLLDGRIKGELTLGKYTPEDAEVRTQKTDSWLRALGW